MKLTDRMHGLGFTCLGRLADPSVVPIDCRCQTLGETILEVRDAIVLAQGGAFAPWLTKAEAVSALQKEHDRGLMPFGPIGSPSPPYITGPIKRGKND